MYEIQSVLVFSLLGLPLSIPLSLPFYLLSIHFFILYTTVTFDIIPVIHSKPLEKPPSGFGDHSFE